jgi:zinc protease
LAALAVYGLPDNFYNDYLQRINAVTGEEVNRVANKYLDPAKMAIVVVGDRQVIEPKLKDLGYAITVLDADGNLVNN